jgi:hypothetical protein
VTAAPLRASIPKMGLSEFLQSEVLPKASALNQDRLALAQVLRCLVASVRRDVSVGPLLSNAELEQVFSVSATLGWTLWQHLGAVEILSASKQWTESNPLLWNDIKSSSTIVGLAVTHINRKDKAFVQARFQEPNLILNGQAPWASGIGLFEKGIVGYSALSGEIGFALIDFPGIRTIPGITHEFLNLAAFNGSASASLSFHDCAVPLTSILSGPRSTEEEGRAQPTNRPPSIYLAPELGWVTHALRILDELKIQSAVRDKRNSIDEVARSLQSRLEALKNRRSELLSNASRTEEQQEDLRFDAYLLIRKSAQAVGVFCGGKGLLADSQASRLHLEVQLLDVTYQSPRMLAKKLNSLELLES